MIKMMIKKMIKMMMIWTRVVQKMICEAMGTAEDLVVAGVNSQFGQQVVHTNKQVEGPWMILYSKGEEMYDHLL